MHKSVVQATKKVEHCVIVLQLFAPLWREGEGEGGRRGREMEGEREDG